MSYAIDMPVRRYATARGPIRRDLLAVAAFMAIYIASSWFGAAGPDTTRDVAAALSIRDLGVLPLHGPLLAGTAHLGPLWFYLLSLPIMLARSWVAVAVFVAVIGSLQFPLAYAAGRRLIDRRFGLLWCALLALPGWGSFQLVGFSHTNMVPVCSMLVLYALVRLAQQRRPRWLVVAAVAFSLALHAHPTTIVLAPVIVIVALLAMPSFGALLRWGAIAILVALLPFAPLVADRSTAAAPLAAQVADYAGSTMHASNLLGTGPLLWAMLARGPRLVADAFVAIVPGLPAAAVIAVLALELAALAGLLFAARRQPLPVAAALLATVAAAALIAWLRPATPFYMTYALLPFLAALGALGLYGLCAGLPERGSALLAGIVGFMLLLHAAFAAGIAATIASGDVALDVASRLDVKQNDATPALAEPWLPAHAVDASGALLCRQQGPIVLHGAYAYLEHVYLGLDHRLRCGILDVHLAGVEPTAAAHLVGIARPAWRALGWTPPAYLGGIGATHAAEVLWPTRGLPPPDGSVYPPPAIAPLPIRTVAIDAAVPGDRALVVAFPYVPWMIPPQVEVTANSVARAALARDAAAAVYACRECIGAAAVAWRISITSSAPERVDVVTIAPTRRE
ncbi:MAG TPA: glycosyltransferase family 39 protein [Casimicrobiaceae bacterium]|nr:glycosyltransferase family 39 protein [Casimicrobiaceae bacterium]